MLSSKQEEGVKPKTYCAHVAGYNHALHSRVQPYAQCTANTKPRVKETLKGSLPTKTSRVNLRRFRRDGQASVQHLERLLPFRHRNRSLRRGADDIKAAGSEPLQLTDEYVEESKIL